MSRIQCKKEEKKKIFYLEFQGLFIFTVCVYDNFELNVSPFLSGKESTKPKNQARYGIFYQRKVRARRALFKLQLAANHQRLLIYARHRNFSLPLGEKRERERKCCYVDRIRESVVTAVCVVGSRNFDCPLTNCILQRRP